MPAERVVSINPSNPTVEKNLPAQASAINCLATTSGETKPADSDMSFVSRGFVCSSMANPGVSVSGGRHKVTDTLWGFTSIAKLSANPRRANFELQYAEYPNIPNFLIQKNKFSYFIDTQSKDSI